MTDESYPAYQYSVFVKNGKDQQIVVRADTKDEFIQRIKDIELVLALDKVETKREEVINQPALEKVNSALDAPVCPVHKKQMVLREGKYGKFWSCGTRDEKGNWCKYSPIQNVEDIPA